MVLNYRLVRRLRRQQVDSEDRRPKRNARRRKNYKDMKYAVAITSVLLLLLTSCEKDYLIPSKEVPEWLKLKISQDEQIIKDNPKSMALYGCWVRYSWQDDLYFEYHNILSSSFTRVVSYDGDNQEFYANDVNTDYYKEKCCKKIVWQGPEFEYYFEK